MKEQTLLKLKEYADAKRVEFVDENSDIHIKFDLDDTELRDLVELEYGQTRQDVVELFRCICVKAIKLALEKGNAPV